MRRHPIKRHTLRDILTITRCANSLVDLEVEKYGLNRGQQAYMVRIVESPGLNQNELARTMKVNKTAVSKALKNLNHKDYIIKVKDESDQRNYKIYPTEKLLELYSFIYAPLISISQKAFENFTNEEMDIYREMTKKVRNNINRYWCEKYDFDPNYIEVDDTYEIIE